jgi:hypothetical protein
VHEVADSNHGWEGVEDAITHGRREFGDFTVIDWFFDPIPDEYYGEFSQGHEGRLFVVFMHNTEDRFFRKEGTGDSYGRHYWNGSVKEVFPKRVEKVVYEYTFEKED